MENRPMSDDAFLVADIGGTNARFAIARYDNGTLSILHSQSFLAEDYASPQDAAQTFLQTIDARPNCGCFAIAAPIDGDIVDFTNSSWVLSIENVRALLGLNELRIVNDFYALAAGISHIPAGGFDIIRAGEGDKNTPVLVLGPGTGLGQALIIPHQNKDIIIATQGGHVNFAPTTDEEIDVLRFISGDYDRVSVERLLSGQGLVNIYRALCAISGQQGDLLQAQEITQAAVNGKDLLAGKAAEMFCAVLGDVAGNAVLSCGARGGVVLGGGILPKIKDFFAASAFVDRFNQKGRMRSYVEDIPIRLLIADGAALYGAAAQL